jgi:hypothetical protein
VISLLIPLLALAKPVTIDSEQLKLIHKNSDCNAGCLNASEDFGWYVPKNKKCLCGHYEYPRDLLEPNLYLDFQRPYSEIAPATQEDDRPWTQYENSSSAPAKMGTFLKWLRLTDPLKN